MKDTLELDFDDPKLIKLGLFLSSKGIREIIKCISQKPMYNHEIHKKTNLPIPLIIYHMKKLIDLGVIEITNKPIKTKNGIYRHYFINKNLKINFKANQKDN